MLAEELHGRIENLRHVIAIRKVNEKKLDSVNPFPMRAPDESELILAILQGLREAMDDLYYKISVLSENAFGKGVSIGSKPSGEKQNEA